MAAKTYDSVVAARTRVAEQILDTPELLDKFLDQGGLERDLTGIRDAGLDAEAAYIGRSSLAAQGKGATENVWKAFAEAQKEYKSIMGVVNIVASEAERNEEPPQLVAKIKGILANETRVTVSYGDSEEEETRTTKKSQAQEDVRTEIVKDTSQLLAFTEIHPLLTERRVTVARLNTLKQKAEDIGDLIAERATVKGEKKSSTQSTYDAVELQRNIWGGAYRILSSLGRKDERVRALLREAKR